MVCIFVYVWNLLVVLEGVGMGYVDVVGVVVLVIVIWVLLCWKEDRSFS